jgi:hypothetical protein
VLVGIAVMVAAAALHDWRVLVIGFGVIWGAASLGRMA